MSQDAICTVDTKKKKKFSELKIGKCWENPGSICLN